MRLNNYEFKTNFYVVNMGDIDMVLGIRWLHDIGEFTLNLREMEMRFQVDGKVLVLKVIRDSRCRMISFIRMEILMQHDMVEWTTNYVLMPTQEEHQKPVYHPHIQELRIKHTKVFSDIPLGKPPNRGIEHIIELE